MIEDNGRTAVDVSLIENDGYHTIDFEAFEAAAREAQNKALIFCSPHNPVGRVWTPEELERLTEIAVANGLYVISDEIWNDFTREDLTHFSLATFDERLDERLVVCISASKTFNLAGAKCAISIVPNEATRERFATAAQTGRTTIVNGFGSRAVEIAYTEGDAWYEAMLQVIHRNQRYVAETFERELPEVKALVCEGTYCAWVDCRALNIDDKALKEWCTEADCFPSLGVEFGT